MKIIQKILILSAALLLCSCDDDSIELLLFQNLIFPSSEIQVMGAAMLVDQELSDTYIEIGYSAPEAVSVVLDVEFTDLPEGLTSIESILLVGDAEGSFQIPIYGTPVEYADNATLNFKLSSVDYSWDLNVDYSIERAYDHYNPDAEPISISNVRLTCPLVAEGSSNFSEEFIISFDYTGGSDYSLIKLKSVTGFLTIDQDELDLVNGVKAQDGDHSAQINLGYTAFASSSDTNFENLTSGQTFSLEFAYNTQDIAGSFACSLNDIDGFIWNNYTYKVLSTSDTGATRVWLDRNLGATSINVSAPEVSSSGVMSVGSSGYTTNFRAYGSYFQYGRANGIPMVLDGVNPIDGSDVPYFKCVANDGGSWETGSWESATSGVFDDGICWNDSSTGGTNNPCPTGFRVPTRDEMTTLSYDLTGIKTNTANATVVPTMMNVMNFPLSGIINISGPSVNGSASTSKGQPWAVGLQGLGYTVDGTTYYGEIVDVSEGQIILASCEYVGNAYGSYYYFYINSTGGVQTSNRQGSNSMPVRCIKHE